MNDEILKKHMEDDAKFQAEMLVWKESIATKEDIEKMLEKMVENIFANILERYGKRSYSIFLIIVGIVAGLTIIGGGLKSLLGWIGFNYMK